MPWLFQDDLLFLEYRMMVRMSINTKKKSTARKSTSKTLKMAADGEDTRLLLGPDGLPAEQL